MTFGEKLKAAREEKGLTRDDVAVQTKIDYLSLKVIEENTRLITEEDFINEGWFKEVTKLKKFYFEYFRGR